MAMSEPSSSVPSQRTEVGVLVGWGAVEARLTGNSPSRRSEATTDAPLGSWFGVLKMMPINAPATVPTPRSTSTPRNPDVDSTDTAAM